VPNHEWATFTHKVLGMDITAAKEEDIAGAARGDGWDN
jgi:hypothetical protein